MPAVAQNITVWQGDTHVIRITVKDDAGAPIDLTGASARWWMAKAVTSTSDSDIFIKKSSDPLVGLSFDQNGEFWRVIIELDPADTETVTPGRWYHECEVVDAVGNIVTVAIGTFTVKKSLIPDVL